MLVVLSHVIRGVFRLVHELGTKSTSSSPFCDFWLQTKSGEAALRRLLASRAIGGHG